jgi:uncharacterized membrane protein
MNKYESIGLFYAGFVVMFFSVGLGVAAYFAQDAQYLAAVASVIISVLFGFSCGLLSHAIFSRKH